MKILVVDDNAVDRRLLRYNLEHHGCEVIEAENGVEGLRAADSGSPDVIVSDALMPEMDGFQFLRRVKMDERLRRIPFIFYSAVYTGDNEAELAKTLGAEAFIAKPLDPEAFWLSLSETLDKCNARKETSATAGLAAHEEEFLRRYSHIVSAKLEDKVRELEQANAEIERKVQEWQTTFDSIDYCVTIHDWDHNVLLVNKSCRRLLGVSEDEIRSKKCYELFHSRGETPESCPQRHVHRTGKSFETEMFEPKLNAWLNIACFPLFDKNGSVRGVVHFAKDITARKNMERKQLELEEQLRHSQRLESVGQLAGGIAHDFNNILGAIIGYGELAKMQGKVDPVCVETLNHMLEGAEKAATLTRSLLAFSRKQTMTMTPLNINDIINRVSKFMVRIIGEDIKLKIALAEYGLNVMADSGQLEQVLFNLSTNARDAMPSGGELTITTRRVDGDEARAVLENDIDFRLGTAAAVIGGGLAEIAVTDTGTGMDAATKEKVFEPFFTTKDIGKGTGLGLSMTYGIVKQHNGIINVSSQPGKGSTFRIYLPLIAAEAEKMDEAAHVMPKSGTETILVAEDNDDLRNLTRAILETFGHKVVAAEDGVDAVAKFRDNADEIRLCILDMVMPGKNGKDAYDEILKIKSGIPALFISGYSSDIMEGKGAGKEIANLLFKPITPVELMGKVREIIDRDGH
jgi:PAS domain S-box-containing protein